MHMSRFFCWCSAILLGASLLSGCATPRPVEEQPLTREQLHAFFQQAQDPRQFWLTVYGSDAGPVVSGGNRLHANRFATAPFVSSRQSTLPLINIRSRHPVEYTAMLDTSSRASWVDFETAHAIGAIPLGTPPFPMQAEHVNDTNFGFLSAVSRLRIEDLHIDTALLYIRAVNGPLGALIRNYPSDSGATGRTRAANNIDASLVLGCDFIKAFAFVQIDYPNRDIIFSTTTSYHPSDKMLVATLPLHEKDGIFAFRGTIDGEPEIFLLDSVGDYEIAMAYPPGSHARRVSLGDLSFSNAAITPIKDLHLGLPQYPRIGRKLLSRYRITIDRSNRVVHFERPDSSEGG